MSNPFDQFDTPAGSMAGSNLIDATANPFDQFDVTPKNTSFLRGASEAMKYWGGSLARGIEQPLQELIGNPERLAQMKKEQDQATADMRKYEAAAPGGTFVGSLVPGLAGITPIVGAALAGAEYGSPAERAQRAGMAYAGGKAGQMLFNAAGRLMSPRTGMSDAAERGIEAADRLGVQTTAGQRSGSKWRQYMETSAANLPGGGSVFDAVQEANTKALNRAAANAIGATSDDLSGAVFSEARQKLGNQFKFLTSNARVQLDKDFADAAEKALQISGPITRYRGTDSAIPKIADDVANLQTVLANTKNADIRMSAADYQKYRSFFDGEAGAAYRGGNNEAGKAFQGVVRALDDAMERSLGGDTRKAFQQARRQWADLMILESGQVVENGNVFPKRVGNALNREYGAAYKEGKLTGPLADIATYGEAFRPLPQSGTGPRNAWNQILLSGPSAAGAFMAGGANPAILGSAVAGSVVAPWAIAKNATSKIAQDYSARGGFARLTPDQLKMIKRVGAMLGGGTTAGLLSSGN